MKCKKFTSFFCELIQRSPRGRKEAGGASFWRFHLEAIVRISLHIRGDLFGAGLGFGWGLDTDTLPFTLLEGGGGGGGGGGLLAMDFT